MRILPCIFSSMLALTAIAVPAQVQTVQQYTDQVTSLTNRPEVKAANNYIDQNHESILQEGISSISTGAGPCDGAHSLAENCEIEPLYKGIKKVLLLEIACGSAVTKVSRRDSAEPHAPMISFRPSMMFSSSCAEALPSFFPSR
jgi:hypothetical protein